MEGELTARRRLPEPLVRQGGQGLVEYSLILALTVIVVIVVLSLMGRQIENAFQAVINTIQGP
jgi:Flp pilus assembly pilin Flp